LLCQVKLVARDLFPFEIHLDKFFWSGFAWVFGSYDESNRIDTRRDKLKSKEYI
jgi:hypothetical protein